MRKKGKEEAPQEDYSGDGENTEAVDFDFNLQDEFKPEPLAAKGNYFGNVIGITFDSGGPAIVWEVVLAENGGILSDGETPVDGYKLFYRNWLPRPGDKDVIATNGRSKHQNKVNMLSRFADRMGILMNTFTDIMEAINNGEWIGIEVVVDVGISEYQGNVRNDINRMSQRTI